MTLPTPGVTTNWGGMLNSHIKGQYAARGVGRGVVVFTWDDGTEDFHSVIHPAQMERGQRSTFFLNGSKLNTSGYLTDAQVIDLHEAGHEIGDHTWGHLDLTTLTATQRAAEYDNNIAALEALVGTRQVRSFAYPFGQHNAATNQETALRYDRTFRVGGTADAYQLPLTSPRSGGVFRIGWTSSSHQRVLQAIREAAGRPVVTVIMGHRVGPTPDEITEAEMLEGLDLADTLGVPCITARDAIPASQLLEDPGFEASTLATNAPWRTSGTNGTTRLADIVADTPVAGFSGTKSLRLTSDGGDVEVSQAVNVIPGVTYVLSGRYRTNVTSGGPMILLRPFPHPDVAGALPGEASAVPGASAAWARFEVTVVAPGDTERMNVYLLSNTSVGEVWFDHLWLSRKGHGNFG